MIARQKGPKLGAFGDMSAHGVQAALEKQGIEPGAGVAALLNDEDEQAELFAQDMAVQAAALNGEAPGAWDGKGRKPGATNITTRRVVDFITSTSRDPLIFWSQVLSMSAEDVKKRWDFGTLGGALAFQNECAKNLAPYLHSKKPLALVIAKRDYTPTIMNFGKGEGAEPDIVGGARREEAIDAPFQDITQKQLLSRSEAETVAQVDSRTSGPND